MEEEKRQAKTAVEKMKTVAAADSRTNKMAPTQKN